MKNENYRRRLIDEKIEAYLQVFGALCIEGPKWCGKTWTSTFHSNSSIFLGDPQGDFQNRRLAEMSPVLILDGENPRLIDEWQEVPALWDAVRHQVDQTQNKGQYILTGSATPNHKGILHSGAGRIARLRMHTMSLFESGDSSGVISLQDMFQGFFQAKMTGEVSLLSIIHLIIRGGWPASIGLPEECARLLPQEYIKAILEDDIYRIDGTKRDQMKMRLLLKSLARNESTTVTNKTLKTDVKAIDDEDIDTDTIANYLNIFSRLFLIENQPPFASQIRSRVRIKQAEKRHFCDPSLPCAILNLSSDRLLQDLETLGFLFEALCERDLKIYAEAIDAKLYHYQDYKGREIDAVIECNDGKWMAIEIKLGANQIDAAAEGLLKIKKEMEEDAHATPPCILCVICGLSNAAYQRPDGVYVIPITALKN